MGRRWSQSARRERFGQWLRKRFALRGFMTWIVVGTTAAGMGINALLFRAGMSELWLRTLIAVVPTYFVFLLLVRVWLGAFSGMRVRKRAALVDESNADALDRLETAVDVVDTATFVADAPAPTFRGRSVASGSDWSVGDLDLDGEGIVLAIVFGLLVLVLALVGGYLIWEAPAILAETLFEFTLASAMAKRLGSYERGSWLGHLVRRTWIPFVSVLVVTGIFAAFVANLRPDAVRLPDLWRSPVLEAPRTP